ncbi:MAG: hypothetical protein ACYS9X_21030 [Planctomycetota bacterium]
MSRKQTIPNTHGITKEDVGERLPPLIAGRPTNPPTTFRFILDPSPDEEWRSAFARIARGTGFEIGIGEVIRKGHANDQQTYDKEIDDIISRVNDETDP